MTTKDNKSKNSESRRLQSLISQTQKLKEFLEKNSDLKSELITYLEKQNKSGGVKKCWSFFNSTFLSTLVAGLAIYFAFQIGVRQIEIEESLIRIEETKRIPSIALDIENNGKVRLVNYGDTPFMFNKAEFIQVGPAIIDTPGIKDLIISETNQFSVYEKPKTTNN